MKLKAVSGIMLTLLFMGMLPLVFNIQPVEANPITIVVPDDYEKIQWAVGNASSGDTVFVRAGTYYENVFVSKTVSLIGENRNTTIIDGAGTTIIDGFHYFGGIFVFADDVKIANFTVRNGSYGICIRGDHNIIGNRVTVTDCVAYNNRVGLEMFQSSQNLLRRNLLFNNSYNLYIGEFWHINEFLHDIDTSNLVNGKPVYYLANKKNVSINPVSFPNIGYLGVVNSTNVRISDLSISRNGEGLLIAFSSDILIERIEATNNFNGIALSGSARTTIRHCNFSYNCHGIFAYYSDYVNIEENTISHNEGGIFLIGLNYGATYHNSFVENGLSPGFYQARTEQSYNCHWDNGYPSGGNYWDDYAGVDLDYDGIGDSPYVIDADNQDNYPLMGMFSSFPISYQEEAYDVDMICNSTISSFEFDHENRIIDFDVTGSDGTIGFCRIMIPTILIESPYTVFVDGEEIAYTLLPISNSTHAFLYFMYIHSTHHIKIASAPPPPVGGKATPITLPINNSELLAPFIGLTLLLVAAVVTVGYVKKRKRKINS